MLFKRTQDPEKRGEPEVPALLKSSRLPENRLRKRAEQKAVRDAKGKHWSESQMKKRAETWYRRLEQQQRDHERWLP